MNKQCVNCPGATDHSTAECPVVREQSKDAERAAFETFYMSEVAGLPHLLSKDEHGQYVKLTVLSAWNAWQARASRPVGAPDGWKNMDASFVVEHIRRTSVFDADLIGQMLEYAINGGAHAAPTVKAEQCMPCGGWGVIAAEPGDPATACEHCNKAPSLPAAGLAVEEVEVVGYRFFHVDHGYIFRRTHIYEGNPSLEAHSLMTVAQHERIVAAIKSEHDDLVAAMGERMDDELSALSAQQSAQSAPERVSVPVEFEPDRSCEDADGCPTELAVLKRFWREHKAQELSGPIREAIKWADHLLFECGALTHTRAPSVHVYNKTFAAVEVAKALLAQQSAPERVSVPVEFPEEWRDKDHLVSVLADVVGRERMRRDRLPDLQFAEVIYKVISEHLPIYEDVYDQCSSIIEPYVARPHRPEGMLPGSVVDSLRKLLEHRLAVLSAQQSAPERVSVPEQWEDKLTRLHPTIQHGKWPKSWQDDAKQQELYELRALLASHGQAPHINGVEPNELREAVKRFRAANASHGRGEA